MTTPAGDGGARGAVAERGAVADEVTAEDEPQARTVGINEVRLVGRLAAPAEVRELPSGDRMVQFRLIVTRSCRRGRLSTTRAPGVDTIDCASWHAPSSGEILGWEADTRLAVEGCLRRRFWRAGGGALASRYEIDVHAARPVMDDAGVDGAGVDGATADHAVVGPPG
jgi:single-strand DNA-binding protein